jgi:large subunit ribosomal protein L25
VAEIRLAAEQRTEFGKGAARRTRRAGKIPAVIYGHGAYPQHVALPAHEFARVIRDNGTNAILSLEIGSDENQLALAKTVVTHPIRNYIEHVDLLIVRKGERIVIDVPITVVGDSAPDTLAHQELNALEVEAEALSIPEGFEVSIEGLEAGTQIHASEVPLPPGVTLSGDADLLVVNVVAAPTAADLEAELDTEGAGVVEDAPETEDAEAGSGAEAAAEAESSDD